MPRKDIDYSKTVIYKITHKDPNNCFIYIGQTTNFIKRKNAHKSASKNENNKLHLSKLYKTINENGGWDMFEILPIEQFPCKNSLEATIRERYWFDFHQANLNTNVPTRSNDEMYILTKDRRQTYYRENKEVKLTNIKQRYIEKRDVILQQKQIYYRTNKETITERNKKYVEANKEKIRERMKKYYDLNREKLLESKKEYHKKIQKERLEVIRLRNLLINNGLS